MKENLGQAALEEAADRENGGGRGWGEVPFPSLNNLTKLYLCFLLNFQNNNFRFGYKPCLPHSAYILLFEQTSK